MSVFEFQDYRDLIKQMMKKQKATYAKFAAAYPKSFSEDALKKLLSQGRTGSRYLGRYQMSQDRFSDFLNSIKPRLKDREIEYLLLLKLRTDAADLGSKRLVRHYDKILQEIRTPKAPKNNSDFHYIIDESLRVLSTTSRDRYRRKMLEELNILISRLSVTVNKERLLHLIADKTS